MPEGPRILAVHPAPGFSVHDVHVGWVEALVEAGATVANLNLDDRLTFYAEAHVRRDGEWLKAFPDQKQVVRLASKGIVSSCYEFQPDVLFVTSCFFVPLDVLDLVRARGTKVVILHTESPYEDDRQYRRAAHADLNLINDPRNLATFKAAAPTYYQPACYRPDVHHPRPATEQYRSDVCFVGTGYPSRIAFLEQIDWSGIDLALAGNWQGLSDDSPLLKYLAHDRGECIDNKDAHELYASTQITFNLYRKEASNPGLVHGTACSPREIELAAAGVFFLRESRQESNELFPMLPSFKTPAQLRALIDEWLAKPLEAMELAEQAAEQVKDRTFDNAARELLRVLREA